MRGKETSEEVKAQVIAALMTGQGVNEVARTYKLPKSTVSELKATIPKGKLEQVRTEKKERLVDLIEQHLSASLKGAIAIASQAGDGTWRNRQSAESLAVFYGVLSDKSIRLCEVAQAVIAAEQEAEPS